MKKILLIICVSVSCAYTSTIYANWLEDIFNVAMRIQGIQTGMLNNQTQMMAVDREMLATQKNIDSLMKELNTHVTGHSGWGNYQSHDYQSYGAGARDWQRVLVMAGNGRGEGDLGHIMNDISQQFPLELDAYNNGVHDANQQQYYALKSQTIVAARAASQLDYNKIEDQIAYQHMLQQQIEKTNDLKSATDLSSRIQVEGNLINLEILRQMALSNQQHAINEQASVSAALSNARFLTK